MEPFFFDSENFYQSIVELYKNGYNAMLKNAIAFLTKLQIKEREDEMKTQGIHKSRE